MFQKKIPEINNAHGPDTRNIINELIKKFNAMGYSYDEALQKTQSVLKEAGLTNKLNDNANTRLDKFIAGSGTSSTEVVDARGEYTILGNRLNDEFNKNSALKAEFIKNLTIINLEHLSKWSNKRARMLDKKVEAKIAFWGDSITEGFYATHPLTLEAKRTKTFVGLLNQYYKNNIADTRIGDVQTMMVGTDDGVAALS